MYRFKVSKYKNVAPKMPKKEQTITEIPLGRIMNSCGNFVTVSAKHIAFNVESGVGGCAGILPINTVGRRNHKVPTIYAHSEFLTDMAFSPFDDDLLATCSHDGTIKLWDIPENFEDTHDAPLLKITPDETTKRVEIVNFHPLADEVLACAAFDAVSIIDLNNGTVAYCVENGSESNFQSMSWRLNGKVMTTSCKDTKNRIIDPRAAEIVSTFDGFPGNKDSRVVWLGDTDFILGTGFNKKHKKTFGLWDVRNTGSLIFEEEEGSGSGTLMPFHDVDTNMIIIAGKGDGYASLFEFNESNKNMTLSSTHSLGQQTFGMGRAPKRILNVMEGEVERFFQLSKNAITPLPYIIPRKSYREFHADLFPDTVYSGQASMNSAAWFSGENKEVIKLSLDPKIGSLKPIVSGLKVKGKKPSDDVTTEAVHQSTTSETNITKNKEEEKKENVIEKESKKESIPQHEPSTVEKKKPIVKGGGLKKSAIFQGVHQSKFKHLKCDVLHKSKNIENIKNLSESLPSESDGFQVFEDCVLLPLSGAGGQIAVCQLTKPGRLPECDLPVLQNSCGVLDVAMDPFDNRNVAVGCEDYHIRLWEIPENGLTETLTTPRAILKGHQQRVTIVKYHPTASDILVSAALDFTVRVWDLSDFSEIGALEGHNDQILCLSWHPDGKYLATYCRDKQIRIYDPVNDVEPMKEGTGPSVTRGARVTWCGPKNNWLVVSTVSGSGRNLFVYNEDLKLLTNTDNLDTSPSVLSLHYDEASCTLFATGKGDSIIYAFEVHEKEPYLHPLSHVYMGKQHQAVSFLRKDIIDVRKIEFARAARLNKSHIELISLTVPRVKMEYFQDDLFSDVRVSWNATMSGEEWLDGCDRAQEWISLQPTDMKKLSEAPKEAPKASKYCSQDILSEKTDEEKKSELINAMMDKLDVDDKLEQDNFEGVDEDEWDD